jgi:limonene-1,2-epoxide hydrolase
MATTESPIELVQRFCGLWGAGDLDGIMGCFAPDAVYHNIPMDPIDGVDAIRATIEGFMAMVERIEFRVLHIAAAGDAVLTERVDAFITPERTIELPVMGTFEVADGRITAWRDYFDLNQFMTQMNPSSS